MRTRSPLRRPLALALTPVLALTLLPFDIAPAEAGRIKYRVRPGAATTYVNRADDETRGRSRSPFSIRIRGNSGSGSAEDERSFARAKPQGAAAAAAARARAALEAESATRATAATVHKPIPVGETRSYSNGVMCVAGC
jgi:hypothetical protein